jgi:tRNA A-37 threonylcarbamoyl transferase component Bud32
MDFYSEYKKIKKKIKKTEGAYHFRLFKRKIGFFIPYSISMLYIKYILHIKIIKILPDVNGVTAIKYAIGKLQDGNGDKVFVKVCIRRRHRNTNPELVEKFNQISNYQNKKINHIYAIKQGVFLNFMVTGYVDEFMDVEEFIKSKEFKNSKNKTKIREKLYSELEKIMENLKKAKVVHNDIHDGNVILLREGKKDTNFYLALTDFSLARQYDDLKKWKKEFKKSDEKEFKKIFNDIRL